MKLAGAGVEVQMESLRRCCLAALRSRRLSAARPGAASAENHVFPLFADRDMANAASYSRKIPLVSYFPGSVSGLAPGSEVTMHGIVVGHVTDVRLSMTPPRTPSLHRSGSRSNPNVLSASEGELSPRLPRA